jgi:esterase/lipase superfamily enzyme
MKSLTLYYATNRNHVGKDRWHPDSYGRKFSDDGSENLRFGRVNLDADEDKLNQALEKKTGYGPGNGNALAGYLKDQVPKASIHAFQESLDPAMADAHQKKAKMGSQARFTELQRMMRRSTDVLIYIHGFNVSWNDAAASALALQEMLNTPGTGEPRQKVTVVLFSWPSDGLALPFASYKSDRTEAKASGYAFGRGILKLRDYLMAIRARLKEGQRLKVCEQDIHLLCHSMGNYVLECSLPRIDQFTPGTAYPRIFQHIFLCAPDVDDTSLEPDQPLGQVHELARTVNLYHNRGDLSMYISDYTKGNSERLGTNGVARPGMLHNKYHQVDCTPVVKGFVEHSYYLDGWVNQDIRLNIAGLTFDAAARLRQRHTDFPTVWHIPKPAG